jgi:hypothetical protein
MVDEMTCNQLALSLDQYMDGEVLGLDRAALDRHIQQCAVCKKLLAREQRLRQDLRQLPAAEPSPDFFRNAMANTVRAGRRTRTATWLVATTAALAASLATWFVIGQFSGLAAPKADSPVATVTMAMDETRTIQLVFNSERAIDDARLSLQLPPGVELAKHGDRQHFNWKTRLHPGNNTLPLELVVRDGAGGDLVARLTHAGDQKTFRVKVTIATRSNHV